MERHPKQLHVRMSDREMESAKSLARELGMTVPDLVRVLLQLPAEEASGRTRLVVVDRTTATRLSREMTRWGHHCNQAAHAFIAIAYYLRANDMETSEVVEELSRAERKLAKMQPGVESLMPRSCRARSILATMRSAWFIRPLVLSPLAPAIRHGSPNP